MLISFSFSNFTSFKEVQTFSLLASEKNDDHQENLIHGTFLKSSLIYGANASGKTNFSDAFYSFREIILDSTSSEEEESHISIIPPFLLDNESSSRPIQFEIVFMENSVTYRYGIAFNETEILEEWLYTKASREAEVFFRKKQEIVYKKSRFTEIDHLIEDKILTIDKTIPVISVAALSSKPICKAIINFVKKIKTISGINEKGFKSITYKLFEEDENFRSWALTILKNFNIHDLDIEHIQDESTDTRSKVRRIKVDVVKKTKEGFDNFPLSFESEGTRKVLYLLGPLYDSIKSNNLLIIDEFDSKFHTLLTKEILKIFHKFSDQEAQLVAIVQDSCLMDSSLLRPDQIWFIDKDNISDESQLYSLVEYKIKKKNHYGNDYLEGQFGAIPLFENYSEIEDLMSN